MGSLSIPFPKHAPPATDPSDAKLAAGNVDRTLLGSVDPNVVPVQASNDDVQIAQQRTPPAPVKPPTPPSFHASVLRWARQSSPRLSWPAAVSRSCPQIAWQRVPDDELLLAPFITDRGLALYLASSPMVPGPECRPQWPLGEPVILPYREVAAFMQPGPLRDELLATRP